MGLLLIRRWVPLCFRPGGVRLARALARSARALRRCFVRTRQGDEAVAGRDVCTLLEMDARQHAIDLRLDCHRAQRLYGADRILLMGTVCVVAARFCTGIAPTRPAPAGLRLQPAGKNATHEDQNRCAQDAEIATAALGPEIVGLKRTEN